MSSRSTRQRKEVARRKYERYQQRKQAEAARKRRIQIIVVAVLVFALVVASVVWATGVFTDDPEPQTQPGNPLVYAKPEQVLTPGTPATATLQMSEGEIEFEMETEDAPKTSNSLAFLAQQGFYDATPCHRLTTAPDLSVLQCGSPDGSANGGPGYTVKDENLPKNSDGNYPAGTIAMAEDPSVGEAGSQFFLVYEDSTLPPNYTIVGEITKGLDVLRAIGKKGTSSGTSDGPPIEPITIETFTVDQA